MPLPSPRRLRPIGGLVLAVAVLVGAGACAGDDAPAATTTPATTTAPTSTEPTVVGQPIATAKGPSVLVFAEPPSALRDGGPTTTTAPARSRPPIPRVGLDSAAVRVVGLGYEFDNPTYFGNPLVFDVVEDHGDWLKVLVPARPNHTVGWVRASDVELSSTTYRMALSLTDRHLVVYDGDRVVVETDVVIGTDATPTPTGRFYLNEKIRRSDPAGAYGPWILSTNGYSEALDLFDGGLPVIAFHGTNQPGLIGSRASNGCVRMPNDVVARLADLLPAGTPVDIVA